MQSAFKVKITIFFTSSYIDQGKNPNLYTKDCLEKALGKNEEVKGKIENFKVKCVLLNCNCVFFFIIVNFLITLMAWLFLVGILKNYIFYGVIYDVRHP